MAKKWVHVKFGYEVYEQFITCEGIHQAIVGKKVTHDQFLSALLALFQQFVKGAKIDVESLTAKKTYDE